MTRITVAPAAAFEIADAAQAYEATRPGLSDAFVSEVDRALTGVRDYPYIAASIMPGFRRCILRRFPYSVAYRVVGDDVQVLALFPTRTDPAQLAARLASATSIKR